VEYFAVVDDGQGPGVDEAVAFEAASTSEKSDEVAQIEATQGDVIAVEPNYPVTSAAIDDPDTATKQWGIASAGFESAWANVAANGDPLSSNGKDVVIAVLDTGVESTHEDLTGGVVAGADFIDGASNNGLIDLGNTRHGTHVAGIAGARDNVKGGIGGAPGATIMSIRVLNSAGSGSYAALINGINHAVGSGAEVVSMSLGGSSFSPQLQNAVTNAHNSGLAVIAAAGNSGSCNALYPAALSGAIAVAATQQSPPDTLASFSERGSWVDIAAPGAGIWSTVNGTYGYKSGTSMATPFVSAAAALILDMCPGTPPDTVEAMLQSTSAPIAGQPIESGALRANAATAGGC